MEQVKCPKHSESFCYLKTGTKSGSTKDASFYICTQCEFVQKTKLPPLTCSIHRDHTIELQGLFFRSERLRRWFRCKGREKGKSWCGYYNVPKTDLKEKCEPDKTSSPKSSREKQSYKMACSDVETCDHSFKKNTAQDDCIKKEVISGHNMNRSMKYEVDERVCSDDAEKYDNQELNRPPDFACSSVSSHKDSKSDDVPVSTERRTPAISVPLGISSKNNFQPGRIKCVTDEDADGYAVDCKTVVNSLKIETGYRETIRTSDSEDDDDDKKSNVACLERTLKEDKKGVLSDSKSGFLSSDDINDNGEQDYSKLINSIKKLEIDERGEKDNSCVEPKRTNATSLHSESESKPVYEGVESASLKSFTKMEDAAFLKTERDKHICDLKQLQASIRTAKLEFLPDKGERIHGKIKDLKERISFLCGKISQVSIQTVVKTEDGNGIMNNPVSKPLMGKPAVSVSPQQSQDSNPANMPSLTLYGGRMTSQRMNEVYSITSEAIAKLHRQLETCPDEHSELSDPDGLQVTLMSHQRRALAWLAWREQQHPPCGILADDMGLGKTLTMISHVLKQMQTRKKSLVADQGKEKEQKVEKGKKSKKRSGTTLIIAPASLIHQWAKEIDRRCHSGCLKYIVYHGPNREMALSKSIDHDIVITTYAIVSREVGVHKESEVEKPVQYKEKETEPSIPSDKLEDLPLLLRMSWERIILDEAHEIKNHNSIKSQSVCRLRAAYRWALTGTPIQNDLKDIYSLIRFLQFSPFDELKVWKKHIELAHESTKRINTIVKALMLRRTKTDRHSSGRPMIKLPPKKSHTIHVELCSEERTVYDKLFRKTLSTVQDYVHRHKGTTDSKATADKSSKPVGASGRFAAVDAPSNVQPARGATGSHLLVLLLRLRQCCCHLSLMKSYLESESLETDGIELSLEEQMKSLMLDEVVDTEEAKDFSSVWSTSPLFEQSSQSTKLKCVMDKIKDIQAKSGDKCVIVSQWTSMLEIVGIHLKRADICFSLIQGSIPAKKRADIVDQFNSHDGGIQIILVSLQAGGVGLNLIGGNHLFLLDCHWNPALEEQACDRIYRLGQEKDVSVYRILCKDTIEERISSLQERKRGLAKSVLTGMGSSNRKLTLDDLCLLFGVN